MYKIPYEIYIEWKDQPILHDEDYYGVYKTVGEMWEGLGYEVEKENQKVG